MNSFLDFFSMNVVEKREFCISKCWRQRGLKKKESEKRSADEKKNAESECSSIDPGINVVGGMLE